MRMTEADEIGRQLYHRHGPVASYQDAAQQVRQTHCPEESYVQTANIAWVWWQLSQHSAQSSPAHCLK